MAYNKKKALEKAQKLVTAGKLKDAITEYQSIHSQDPGDQTTLNTLGDLNVRTKNIPEALNYYIKLADVYIKGGFLVRGIAMYKKISKLDPKNTKALERLAELYTMQGLMSEARSHYLKLGESLLKDGKTDKALDIMQKLLDLEPDNTQLQIRLGSLFEAHKHLKEAADIYRRIGDRMLLKGESEQAVEWIEKAAKLSPNNPELTLLQARALQAIGKNTEAMAALETIENVEDIPAAVEVLVGGKLAGGDIGGATELAERQFDKDNTLFSPLLKVAHHAAEAHDAHQATVLLKKISAAALESDPFNFLIAVRQACEKVPESIEANELLLEAGKKAHDKTAQIEALTRIGADYETESNWKKAREAYSELLKLEPANTGYVAMMNRVREQMGEAVMAPPPDAVPEQDLDEDTQQFVASALSDVDLFGNYGMADKAIEKALEILARVPTHRETNERLLDFYIAANNKPQIAKIADRLEDVYRNLGNTDRADELAVMAKTYGEGGAGADEPAAASAEAEAAAPEPAAPEATAEAEPVAEAPVAEEVEIPLTMEEEPSEPVAEAAAPMAVEEAAPAEAPADELPSMVSEPGDDTPEKEASDEVKFYLDQGMADQARDALSSYERDFPEAAWLDGLRAKVEAAETTAAPPPAPEPEPEPVPEPEPEPVVEVTPEPEPAAAEMGGFDFVLEKESESGGVAVPQASDFLSDLASDLDSTLAGIEELGGSAPSGGSLIDEEAAAAFSTEAPATKEQTGDLTELAGVFSEFREDLGGDEEEVEDVETHYNLGTAYREMGLHEEAISEFQKSAKAAESQKDFHHMAQSCILLAICFRERGLPKVGVTWYDRALKVPGLDSDASLAIRFDKGEALDEAGEKKAALDIFQEVYGSDVDYRNVGDRIRDLQGS